MIRLGPPRSVLITRAEPEASATAARVYAMGWEPVISPMASIRPLAAHLPAAGIVKAVLLTSGNAVAALANLDRQIPVLTVGHATAERAQEAGFSNVNSADGDASALAALAFAKLDPHAGPVLLVCGRGHAYPLAAALRAQKFRVLRRSVYVLDPAGAFSADGRTALREGRLSAALFFSAAAARHFATLMEASRETFSLHQISALAISQQTGMALSSLPWRQLLIAAKPNQEGLLALLR